MAVKTEHLGLHQWEPEDSFLRADFNEDFGKIDGAIKAVQALASGSCVAGSVLITNYQADINMELGFRPKLVVYGMDGSEYQFIYLLIEGIGMLGFSRNGAPPSFNVYPYDNITDTGVQLSVSSWAKKEDVGKTTLHYVAFR